MERNTADATCDRIRFYVSRETVKADVIACHIRLIVSATI
jgi:hypothetical protein